MLPAVRRDPAAPSPPPARLQPPAPPPDRRRLLLAGAVVLVLALAAVLLLLLPSDRDAPPGASATGNGARAQQPPARRLLPPRRLRPPTTPSPPRLPRRRSRPAPAIARSGRRRTRSASPRAGCASAREVDHGAYIESRWHPPGRPEVYALVDRTPGLTVSPAEAAASVRGHFPGRRQYTELSFEAATLGGRPAWRWQFQLAGETKVDWFLQAATPVTRCSAPLPPSASRPTRPRSRASPRA